MEPDRLTATLTLLDSTDLARQVRSLAWRASRSLQQGRPAIAAWHATLAELVADELSVRGGSRTPVSSPLCRLRRATRCLSARDQFLLAVEYEAQLADVEAHGLRPPARLIAVIGDELRRAITNNQAAATHATVPEPQPGPTPIRP